jgi:hypothetical protein
MMEHPCLLYMYKQPLLTEALSLGFGQATFCAEIAVAQKVPPNPDFMCKAGISYI